MTVTPNTICSLIVGRLQDYQYGKEPAIGVAHDDSGLVCRLIKGGVMTTKTLTSDNWGELGGGFYRLDLTAEEVGGEGELIVGLECQYSFLPWQIRIEVKAELELPPAEDIDLSKLDDLHSRFFNRVEKTASEIIVYDTDGTTPLFVQAWNASGASENIGAAE